MDNLFPIVVQHAAKPPISWQEVAVLGMLLACIMFLAWMIAKKR